MVGHQDPRIFEDSPQIEGFCAARTVPRLKLVFCLHRLPLPPSKSGEDMGFDVNED